MAAENDGSPARLLPAFVGRERELAELRAGLADTVAGRGRLFLISGEPGIGKTRLAEEVCTDAAATGAAVVWGRCWEGGGAPAYWPWVQVFRRLGGELETAELRAVVGDAAAEIAAFAPELAARVGVIHSPAAPRALESEQERFPLFDATAGILRRLAARRPLVLVLDDLHAADQPSLLLLEFVARDLRDSRLLLLGTYREIEAQRDAERARLLHGAARSGTRLPLGGLSREQVERLVRAALPPSGEERRAGELAERIFRSTGGNPFFVDEVLRLVLAAPPGQTSELPLPHGVRDAVRERIRPLSPLCRRMLDAAAVLGHEFDLSLLDAIDGDGESRTARLDAIGEAETNGVITRSSGTLARYAFVHALIRETLYDEVAPAERARLHWAVVEALARPGSASGDEPLAELAHHALRGVAAGDAARAVDYAVRAGERATAQLAYEEAAGCFRQALEGLAFMEDAQPLRRAELLLACGEAEAQAWNTSSAQQSFDSAAALARELRGREPELAGDLLARAALGFGRTGLGVPRGGRTDPALVARLEEAVAALGPNRPALRARVLARLAVELYYSDATARRGELASEAAQLARECGDPSTLAYVLTAQHFALWDSPGVDWRLALADEAVRTAQRAGEPDTEVVARLWHLLDVVEKGDVHRWERELDQLEAVARALRQPRSICFALTTRAMRALWHSRFDEVDAFGLQALAIGERAQDTGAAVNYTIQRIAVMRARGEHEALLPEVELLAQGMPGNPNVDCMRTLLHADLGHIEEARRGFERLAADDFAELRSANGLFNILVWVAEICARVGDRDRARVLEREIRPRAHTNLAFNPRILHGPGTHWLGLLAATLDRADEAVELLTNAAARSRSIGGDAAAAWSDLELARVLIARDGQGDRANASDLLACAASVAEAFGLGLLARHTLEVGAAMEQRSAATAMRASAGAAAGGHGPQTSARVIRFPTKASRRPPLAEAAAGGGSPRYVLRREGEFWTASDGDTVLRLKDTKGLRYIAQLLRDPDREFHVLDLIAAERDGAGADGASIGGTGEAQLHTLGMHATADAEVGDRILDPQARTAYQRRLEDLRDDLEEATRNNDPGRAGQAREEMDFIARELARAVGLGGRNRTSSSGAERARINVTRAVKAVVRRISEENPNLGLYLATTIHTGTFCSYRPDPRLKVIWKLS